MLALYCFLLNIYTPTMTFDNESLEGEQNVRNKGREHARQFGGDAGAFH
jgi:hypothetical protein